MKVKANIISYLVVMLFCCTTSCKKEKSNLKVVENQNSITYKTFEKDSIWYKVYRKFNNKILRPTVINVFQSVSDSTKLSMADIGLFNMLIQNYDCSNLKVSDFQTKYPFAKYEFVKGNFDKLVEKELFKREKDFYQLTVNGNDVLNLLKRNYQAIDDTKVDNFSLDILNRVSQHALSNKFTGINKSLKNCQKASLRFDDSKNKFVQLLTVMNHLVALRNDQSHYRYSFLETKPYSFKEELSYPIIELLAGYYNSKSFNPNNYLNRPTWGYNKKETNEYVDYLKKKDLIDKSDSLYTLSKKAEIAEKQAIKKSEEKFYEPWLFLTNDDYKKFKKTLQ